MATLNLGRIKPVFKGAYDNSTAYVVDDIVTSGGSSYICIQASTGNAVSNATYWTQMAAGGTDVGTTITTQGDILYRDGSGLQRLPKGTAGQVLKINSGATAPEWGTDAGGGMLQAKHVAYGNANSSGTVVQNNSFTSATEFMSVSITPSATSSYIMVTGMFHLHHIGSYEGYWWLTYQIAGGSEQMIAGNSQTGKRRTGRVSAGGDSTSNMTGSQGGHIMFAPNTTSAITIRLRGATSESGYPIYFNRDVSNSTNNADGGATLSTMTAFEIAGAISPNISDTTVYRGT